MVNRAGRLFAVCLLFGVCATAMTAPAATTNPNKVFAHTQALQGLLPVHVDKQGGRIGK